MDDHCVIPGPAGRKAAVESNLRTLEILVGYGPSATNQPLETLKVHVVGDSRKIGIGLATDGVDANPEDRGSHQMFCC